MPEEMVKNFFLKGTGKQEGLARVRPELRNMITFRQINLLDESTGRCADRSMPFSAAMS